MSGPATILTTDELRELKMLRAALTDYQGAPGSTFAANMLERYLERVLASLRTRHGDPVSRTDPR